MAYYHKPLKLGEILVKEGIVSMDVIVDALEQQKQSGSGEKLGSILVKNGHISPDTLVTFLAKQYGLNRCPIGFWDKPPAIDIPLEVIKKFRVFPVRIDIKDRLVLAMADPFKIAATDEVKFVTKKDIVPEIALIEDIDRAIHRWYGTEFNENDYEISEESDDIDGPAARKYQEFLEMALLENASDIHLEPHKTNGLVRFRVDGSLRNVENLPKNIHMTMVNLIKVKSGLDIAERRLPQDGQIKTKTPREVDLRVSTMPTIYGEKVVLRILDRTKVVPKINSLGFAGENLDKLKKLTNSLRQGLILVTGPTGSGKSTTLCALIEEIKTPGVNINTIEDPPEYEMQGVNQVAVNRKAGMDFAVGLKALLRQDPDIIFVGEIRDQETARIAIQAALTGHLVLSSLHTNDAISSIARLTDMGIEPYMISATLKCVISQRLIRLNCKNCIQTYTPEPVLTSQLGVSRLKKGKGCIRCNYTGYKGQTAIAEILIIDDDIKELIRKNAPTRIIKELALKKGVSPIEVSLKEKVLAGLTTIEEMVRIAAYIV